jgi:hypothetical protein
MDALEYFRFLAPEFDGFDDATVNQWLSVAEKLVNVGCLDAERSAMALALYAAHMLSISLRTEQGGSSSLGAVTSEKEGDLQRSYSGLKGADTYLGQTNYGQQYIEVTRACFGSAIMTRGIS